MGRSAQSAKTLNRESRESKRVLALVERKQSANLMQSPAARAVPNFSTQAENSLSAVASHF
jgi:hypothetical protein